MILSKIRQNEENNSTNEGAEDGEAVVFPCDIDIEVDADTKEVIKNSPRRKNSTSRNERPFQAIKFEKKRKY